jgi:ATP-binding cassette subfamily F protein 3
LEAVLWLESYLVEYKHTLIVVSHDRGFLNEVCTDIIEFDKKKLTYYRGNYDSYVKARDEKIKNDMRVYHAYQDKRAHMMEFIEKFRANAKRATMVQSRIKAVEKMDAEAPEPIEVESVWRFSIPNPEPLGRPIISVDDVSFDYKPVLDDGTKKAQDAWLLQMVNFGVDLSSRIGILGANGCGKVRLCIRLAEKCAWIPRFTLPRLLHSRHCSILFWDSSSLSKDQFLVMDGCVSAISLSILLTSLICSSRRWKTC